MFYVHIRVGGDVGNVDGFSMTRTNPCYILFQLSLPKGTIICHPQDKKRRLFCTYTHSFTCCPPWLMTIVMTDAHIYWCSPRLMTIAVTTDAYHDWCLPWLMPIAMTTDAYHDWCLPWLCPLVWPLVPSMTNSPPWLMPTIKSVHHERESVWICLVN